jgi:magnesium and cobalt exporter, CNNM family
MQTFIAAVSVALIASFLCSIFESVLLSIGTAQVEALAGAGKRSGRLLKRFKQHIDHPIAAILILNTVAHTIGAAVAGATYERVFDPSTLWIFSLVFTTAVLIFTEIVPKTLGVAYSARLATPVAYAIHALTIVLHPAVVMAAKLSRALRGKRELPVTSVEEIRLLASLGRNEGVVGLKTAGMILGATELREVRAADVMLPRQQVAFLSGASSAQETLAALSETGFSRFPFSPSQTLDQVTGIVLAREVLEHMVTHPGAPIAWSELVREPLVVPAGQPLNLLLRAFQETRNELALVVDEYGDIEGIVTLEDVLEEIVGEIVDELDAPLEGLVEQADGTWIAGASVDLRRACAQLGLDWDARFRAHSLGGLVVERLGRIPVVGDAVDWMGFRLEVRAADERRATEIAIAKQPSTIPDDGSG